MPVVSCNFILSMRAHVCLCMCVRGWGDQYMSFSVHDHLSNLFGKFECNMMEFWGSTYRWLWSADFLGLAFECTQMSSNVSSDKTHTDCSCFYFTRPVFPEMYLSVNNILLIWQEVNHQESNFEICPDTFYRISSLYNFQEVSTVCAYLSCILETVTLHMCSDFLYQLRSHGHHFVKFMLCLCLFLCVNHV